MFRNAFARSPFAGDVKQKAEENAETENVRERNQTVWEESATSVIFSSADGAEAARQENAPRETREGAEGLGSGRSRGRGDGHVGGESGRRLDIRETG